MRVSCVILVRRSGLYVHWLEAQRPVYPSPELLSCVSPFPSSFYLSTLSLAFSFPTYFFCVVWFCLCSGREVSRVILLRRIALYPRPSVRLRDVRPCTPIASGAQVLAIRGRVSRAAWRWAGRVRVVDSGVQVSCCPRRLLERHW